MMPRVLEFLGSGVAGSDYLDAIVDSAYEPVVIGAFARALDKTGFMVQCGQLNGDSSVITKLAARLTDRSWRVEQSQINTCPYIAVADLSWDAYLSQLSSNQRYNFNRRLRSLEKTTGFRIQTATGENEAEAALQVLLTLHGLRWASRLEESDA